MMQFSMEATLSRWTAEQARRESAVEHGGDELADESGASAPFRLLGVRRCTSTGRREKQDLL